MIRTAYSEIPNEKPVQKAQRKRASQRFSTFVSKFIAEDQALSGTALAYSETDKKKLTDVKWESAQ
jgi:hypothetical protein